MTFLKDFSLSAAIAGFVSVLVGFTSAGVIVFQAAQTMGASPTEIGSWLWALGWGMGLTGIILSLRYRVPIVMAWSTPGAAMLVTTTADVSLQEATGAFLICGALITLFGFTGWFEQLIERLPLSLASAMLAGVLLQFGLHVFTAMQTQFVMVFPMFCLYLIMRRLCPRYTVVAALGLGILLAGVQGLLQMETVQLQWATPVFITPQFSVNGLMGIALPLFIVTMTSQNVPGVATIRAFGYQVPSSPLISWSGVATLCLAPFGAFAINLAAITAAISMGQEAHEDPARRYVAAVMSGVFYIVVGLFGATVVGLFSALPRELVVAIAGLALLSTIGKGLVSALTQENEREPALITFLVTASGISLLGIGSAFWGLLAGTLAILIARLNYRVTPP
ncbi:benzoate/H(+) symporter BenE family transporter [Leptothoe sp. PORK10 BA2]|uniref:benzoate/H(+) symporter BenE family transporter n=1 Tax=Leptothoe sp. PORK10 BA2 TaxID=3110254 RepID=UPI002B1EAC6B|nr:benzoate/H(+) symporter BenE family transporter [Leptothoe sp. PORK10 BA2]MEA5466640.1 benzoate/H(+) symporter BenE family transporter [Leptothoe sp. PORK10 BA2]